MEDNMLSNRSLREDFVDVEVFIEDLAKMKQNLEDELGAKETSLKEENAENIAFIDRELEGLKRLENTVEILKKRMESKRSEIAAAESQMEDAKQEIQKAKEDGLVKQKEKMQMILDELTKPANQTKIAELEGIQKSLKKCVYCTKCNRLGTIENPMVYACEDEHMYCTECVDQATECYGGCGEPLQKRRYKKFAKNLEKFDIGEDIINSYYQRAILQRSLCTLMLEDNKEIFTVLMQNDQLVKEQSKADFLSPNFFCSLNNLEINVKLENREEVKSKGKKAKWFIEVSVMGIPKASEIVLGADLNDKFFVVDDKIYLSSGKGGKLCRISPSAEGIEVTQMGNTTSQANQILIWNQQVYLGNKGGELLCVDENQAVELCSSEDAIVCMKIDNDELSAVSESGEWFGYNLEKRQPITKAKIDNKGLFFVSGDYIICSNSKNLTWYSEISKLEKEETTKSQLSIISSFGEYILLTDESRQNIYFWSTSKHKIIEKEFTLSKPVKSLYLK